MNKKDMWEIGALALGAAAIFFLMRNAGAGQATASGGDITPPNYLDYNTNKAGWQPASNLQLPQVGASNGGGCQCGSTAQQITFSDSGSFAQSMSDLLGPQLASYETNVLKQFPNFVTQYFNDPFGAQEYTQSQTQFASMLGGSTGGF